MRGRGAGARVGTAAPAWSEVGSAGSRKASGGWHPIAAPHWGRMRKAPGMRPLSIAALQTAPVFGDPAATLERFAERLPRLAGVVPHAQLVVLPELYLAAVPELLDEGAGYTEQVAVEVPVPLTERLGELARDAGVWLVAGSVYERAEGGAIHNTVPVLSPEGALVARYRKVFPWQPHETTEPGGEFVSFDVPEVGRVGLAI